VINDIVNLHYFIVKLMFFVSGKIAGKSRVNQELESVSRDGISTIDIRTYVKTP